MKARGYLCARGYTGGLWSETRVRWQTSCEDRNTCTRELLGEASGEDVCNILWRGALEAEQLQMLALRCG